MLKILYKFTLNYIEEMLLNGSTCYSPSLEEAQGNLPKMVIDVKFLIRFHKYFLFHYSIVIPIERNCTASHKYFITYKVLYFILQCHDTVACQI